MAECQSRCVEGLSRSSPSNQVGSTTVRPGNPPAPARTVHGIAHDRVTHMLQVHPNLVGPAGVELHSEQVDALESRHHGRFGSGGPAFR
jgi:hypothetical protein